MRRLALPLLCALLLAACGDDDELDLCGPDVEKRALADVVYDWYLYPGTLPPVVDTSLFATSAALLDHMTAQARALDLDRGWSYVTTVTAAQTYFEEGTTVGFGIQFVKREPDRLLVTQVYPDSPAAEAGFARGDEILRVGESAVALVEVAPHVANDLANGTSTVGQLFGPSAEGVVRVVEVIPLGATEPVQRSMAKRTFSLDPVPVVDQGLQQRWRIFERNGRKLGYVALRTFVSNADAPLAEAFAAFKAAGVTDVAVDLRYNGGGLVTTAELLANLLGGGLAGETMLKVTNSEPRFAYDEVGSFGRVEASVPVDLTEAITATRIAFITTEASASASELVPNVLEPWREVALVGASTYGKPVGQRGFRLRGCEAVVYLVSFKLENAQGDGEYFGGLPDESGAFSGPLCGAADDLTRPLGDPDEAMTAAALGWLETGSCPTPIARAPALLAQPPRDAYPTAPAPTLAQRHLPGLF